jgi:hypothetical protein
VIVNKIKKFFKGIFLSNLIKNRGMIFLFMKNLGIGFLEGIF